MRVILTDNLLMAQRLLGYNDSFCRALDRESRRLMLGSIGMPELIIIFVIALIIFGPRKLPELGRSLGKSLAEFKRASNELKSTLEEEIRLEETRSTFEASKAAAEAAKGDAARTATT